VWWLLKKQSGECRIVFFVSRCRIALTMAIRITAPSSATKKLYSSKPVTPVLPKKLNNPASYGLAHDNRRGCQSVVPLPPPIMNEAASPPSAKNGPKRFPYTFIFINIFKDRKN